MKRLLPLLLAFAASLAAAGKLVGGPFTVNVTTRAATVVWIVQSDELILRPPAGVEGRYSPAFQVEKTTLTGLQPGTHYDYELPGFPGVKGSFRTAAAPAEPIVSWFMATRAPGMTCIATWWRPSSKTAFRTSHYKPGT